MVMRPKDADGMANSVDDDPDLGLHCLLRHGCPKIGIIMVAGGERKLRLFILKCVGSTISHEIRTNDQRRYVKSSLFRQNVILG